MKILIIGANGGLGKELTSKLIKDNSNELILCSRKKALPLNKNISFIKIDFFEKDFNKKILKTFDDIYPDIVVHCSGGVIKNDGHPIEEEVLKDTLHLNLNAAIAINKILINNSIKKKNPLKIIHIGSDSGFNGYASPCYSISKAALHTYVKNISRNYVDKNIWFSCIAPSIFEHENSVWAKRKINNHSNYEKRLNETTHKKFSTASDVAEIILSVMFTKSSLFNGEIIIATGGERV
ncbi:SDR family oxidoreductase [Aliarcobacter cryaerophilus]|uniref:SDR family oxidoreductase n=1 Tax=Aliarcobacter cryaerophilus TaxID=28198 RepID=UPI000834A7AB|nr:SDR family oxidoreductase [Aliarcobacter cryaerophilus]